MGHVADQVQFVKTFFSQHSVVTIIIAYTVPTSESAFKKAIMILLHFGLNRMLAEQDLLF
jgi:hypothetical protein